jgi:hypothetical protein
VYNSGGSTPARDEDIDAFTLVGEGRKMIKMKVEDEGLVCVFEEGEEKGLCSYA